MPDNPVLNKAIDLPKSKGTVYEMLHIISEVSGMLFIYNNKTLDNNSKTRIKKGKNTLQQAILDVTQKPDLKMKVIGNHILLYTETAETTGITSPAQETGSAGQPFVRIEGEIKDQDSFEPLPFTSVTLNDNSIGTVANQNGQFLLKIPDSLKHGTVRFSYVGYESRDIPIELLTEGNMDIFLHIKVISIQEIIINIVNPLKIVNEMLEKRSENYFDKPVYLTAFYREGIDYKNGFINLTEAVFNIYKHPFHSGKEDQVKLLKMRKISNKNINDSILLKLKAGISASLLLDLIGNPPDFLETEEGNPYNYAKIDMTTIDSRPAHVIAFEQKPGIEEPLYKGELYIDAENSALLSAHFGINPLYVKKAKSSLVVKQSKGVDISPKEVVYTVSYKEFEGKYYLHYIRGDLNFTVKKKGWLFNRSSTINSFFEMVVSNADLTDVKPFHPGESLPTSKIFSETKYNYDPNFWGNFNVILPEQKLSDEIERISSKIEESF
jgi:hypothetical protein